MRQIILTFLTLTRLALGDGPNPKEVAIQSIQYGGSGCPQESVAEMLSPDAKAFTLLFDRFVVEGGEKHCRVNVKLKAPRGWSLTLFFLDYRGFANLTDGATAKQKTTYQFRQGTAAKVGEYKLKGPFSDDYFNRTITEFNQLSWSDCQTSQKLLQIDTQVVVKGEGLMTVDSLDGQVKHHYGIAWRKCQ